MITSTSAPKALAPGLKRTKKMKKKVKSAPSKMKTSKAKKQVKKTIGPKKVGKSLYK